MTLVIIFRLIMPPVNLPVGVSIIVAAIKIIIVAMGSINRYLLVMP